jgi:hypothetical protein
MLLINQRLDNLAASRVDFANRGMLKGTCLSYILNQLGMSMLQLYFIRCTNLFEITQGSAGQPKLSGMSLLMQFPDLAHMMVTRMMKVMPLLDPEFWRIPTWQKQSVSRCSGHLTFSCIY